MSFFSSNKNIIFITLGWFFFILGLIGIPLPLLPTTPFLLLSAFCFSKGSKKLYKWISEHKIAGPIIQDYQKRGAISINAKFLSISMLTLSMSIPLVIINLPLILKILIGLTGISVAIFILSRPSH